jgi:hypothetical protein
MRFRPGTLVDGFEPAFCGGFIDERNLRWTPGMCRPSRQFLLTLAVACFGLGFGCAPTARADFFPTFVGPRTSPTEQGLLQPFSSDLAAGESAWGGATASCDTCDQPTKALPEPLPLDGYALMAGFSSMLTRGSSGGFGSTSAGPGTGQNSPTAGLPLYKPFLFGDEVVGFLALKEAAWRPPAFASRLFRPPRQD